MPVRYTAEPMRKTATAPDATTTPSRGGKALKRDMSSTGFGNNSSSSSSTHSPTSPLLMAALSLGSSPPTTAMGAMQALTLSPNGPGSVACEASMDGDVDVDPRQPSRKHRHHKYEDDEEVSGLLDRVEQLDRAIRRKKEKR